MCFSSPPDFSFSPLKQAALRRRATAKPTSERPIKAMDPGSDTALGGSLKTSDVVISKLDCVVCRSAKKKAKL
jgi:hypothetical protein